MRALRLAVLLLSLSTACSALPTPPVPAVTYERPALEEPTLQPTPTQNLAPSVPESSPMAGSYQTESPPRKPVAATSTPAPTSRSITLDLSGDQPSVLSDSKRVPSNLFTASDFLQDYLTNRTRSDIIEGKPWTNGTINYQQRQAPEHVTYWDFFSEHENWDSPSYLWQDDDGNWRPYEIPVIRDRNGREVTAYLLLDRKGPGVMDKLWFTEDAVWMLETAQSREDVGPIPNMDAFIEWGNLEKLGNLRLEVDGRVAYDGPVKDWLDGKAWGLTPELTQILTWRHREFGSSGTLLPVLYQDRLRALLYGGSKKPKWFLATGVRFAPGFRVQSYAGTAADLPVAALTRLAGNVSQPENYLNTLPNQHSLDLQVQANTTWQVRIPGQGTVQALQFRISKKDDPRQLWLRVRYGDQTAISLPLIAFFGDHSEIVPHRSTPFGIVQVATGMDEFWLFYSNSPLPFQNGMTLELTTPSANPIPVSVRLATSLDSSPTQLWVNYRPAEKLVTYGPDYVVQLSGSGKLAGLVLVSQEQGLDEIPRLTVPGKPDQEDPVKRAWSMGYLEGDLILTDGAGDSRMYGGQEDWADGGFYFNRGYTSPPGGSNRPFGGILRYKDGKYGYATIFRYLNDLSAFRYKDGLTLAFGHGTWNNNFPVRYGTTVYYYKDIR